MTDGLRRKVKPENYAFLTFIGFAYLVILLMPFSPYIQEKMMRKFHLSNESALEWMCWQVIPSMYNFENSAKVIEGELLLEAHRHWDPMWFNHYPVRVLTFFPHRHEQGAMVIDFSTVYQGRLLHSRIHWTPRKSGFHMDTEFSRLQINR